jgi:hypothetical protein
VVERTRWNLRKPEKRESHGGEICILWTWIVTIVYQASHLRTSDILYDREFHCNTEPSLRVGIGSHISVLCQLYRSIPLIACRAPTFFPLRSTGDGCGELNNLFEC